jgi:hypothetical protein
MSQKTGIFGRLRRRRWVLSLSFGYALLLNALLGTSIEGVLTAAAADPLAAVAAAPLCNPVDSRPASPGHAPADHQQTCPLCGPACPMGGCAPVQSTGLPTLASPREVFLASGIALRLETSDGRSLYASDTDSQGPPAL